MIYHTSPGHGKSSHDVHEVLIWSFWKFYVQLNNILHFLKAVIML